MIRWIRNEKWVEGFDADINGVVCNVHRFDNDRWAARIGNNPVKCFDTSLEAISYCEGNPIEGSVNLSDYAFETASEYVMDKNEELYQRFSPDWSSPPSDTIKDILEERGENYDDFIVEASHWSGDHYIVEGIESVFDGELEMTPSIALFLSEKLGSSENFWLKRSALYRVQQEAKKKFSDLPRWKPTIRLDPLRYDLEQDLVDKVLEQIISQCLSAQVKMFDTPCSASSHLNFAIAALSELIPDYNPDDEEMRQALEWAISEGKILRGEEE